MFVSRVLCRSVEPWKPKPARSCLLVRSRARGMRSRCERGAAAASRRARRDVGGDARVQLVAYLREFGEVTECNIIRDRMTSVSKGASTGAVALRAGVSCGGQYFVAVCRAPVQAARLRRSRRRRLRTTPCSSCTASEPFPGCVVVAIRRRSVSSARVSCGMCLVGVRLCRGSCRLCACAPCFTQYVCMLECARARWHASVWCSERARERGHVRALAGAASHSVQAAQPPWHEGRW